MTDDLKFKLIALSVALGFVVLGGIFLWRYVSSPPEIPQVIQKQLKTAKEDIKTREKDLQILRTSNDKEPDTMSLDIDALVDWYNRWLHSSKEDSAEQDRTNDK